MSGKRPGEVRWFSIAVQALAVIATSDGACPSAAIAGGLASHPAFLRRVLALLVRAGIVEALEGRAGGYLLARPAYEITLAEIYRAVRADAKEEHPAAGEDAPTRLASVLDEVAAEAERAVRVTLARHTLAEVMARAGGDVGGCGGSVGGGQKPRRAEVLIC